MRSVLQDWVMELPLREQGTLVVAMRGCDLTPKFPLDSIERRLTAAIRGYVLNAADPREIDREPGSFMSHYIPIDIKVSTLGHYPLHWVSHVMHATQCLAYRHPNPTIAAQWYEIYYKFCDSLHVNPEHEDQFERRLIEDRIAKGSVVS